jgi:hypothetical protein
MHINSHNVLKINACNLISFQCAIFAELYMTDFNLKVLKYAVYRYFPVISFIEAYENDCCKDCLKLRERIERERNNNTKYLI